VIQIHLLETYVVQNEMLHCESDLPLLAMMTDAHGPSLQ